MGVSSKNYRRRGALAGLTASIVIGGAAVAAPLSLRDWAATAGGRWSVSAEGGSAFHAINGAPTILASGAADRGRRFSADVTVEASGDDDFFGFVLGFDAGEEASALADYILIDWKKANQRVGGCIGTSGLAVSRVSGPLRADAGAWCHDSASGVTELARAQTLGAVGWLEDVTYTFDVTFTGSLIEVFVNGALELSVAGAFGDGSFGLYNNSQRRVRYANLRAVDINAIEAPIPGAAALMGSGLAGLALAFGRKRRPRANA